MYEMKWSVNMVTGIEEMDIQHRGLVAIYNRLHHATLVGKGHKQMNEILGDLIAYTRLHFAAEEAVMTEMGYPGLDDHRHQHEQLMAKVDRFKRKLDLGQERITMPVMKFLSYWLKTHIMQSDVAYGAYARENAEAEEENHVPA